MMGTSYKLWGFLLVSLLLTSCFIHAQDDVEGEDVDDTVEDADVADEAAEPAEELKTVREKPVYKAPIASGNIYFSEAFPSEIDFADTWVLSQAKKDDIDADIAKYDGKWSVEEPTNNPMEGDLGLVLKSKAKHHAVSALLDKPFEFKGEPLVVQYEVKFQNGQDCGGAYIKLLSQQPKLDLKDFKDSTGYTIMFGPDKCGNDNKFHFIFRHKHPVKGTFEEKHAKKPTATFNEVFTDKLTHLFTLVVKPDNTYELYIDQNLVNSGSLLKDVEPPVNPQKEVVDPDDTKPQDWDEREKIPDPDATKPEDWDEDEPEKIADPEATQPEGWLEDEPDLIPDADGEKPADWDDDMDGEWEPPMISNPKCESAPGCGEWTAPDIKNPKYKGKWRASMIDNPDYKGKWVPKKIANPDYFEDKSPYKMTPIAAVGLELWSMSDDILFDNLLITDEKETADKWAAESWEIKRSEEMMGSTSGKSVVQAVLDATTERPWLWAVFLIVIVLPVILILAYCCGFMGGGEKKADDISRMKKTDAPSPDDQEEEAEEEAEEEVVEEEKEEEAAATEDKVDSTGDAKSSPKKSSKASKASKSDLEVEENEADAEDEGAEEAAAKSSPRRRKTRARKE